MSASDEIWAQVVTELGIIIFAAAVPLISSILDGVGGGGFFTAAAGLFPFGLLVLNARALVARLNVRALVVFMFIGLWGSLGLFGVAWGYASEVVAQSVKVFAWGAFYFVCYVSARRDGSSHRLLLWLGLSALPAALEVLFGLITGRLEYNPVQGQLSFETFSINKSITHVVLAFASLWLSLSSAARRWRPLIISVMVTYVLAIVLANARVGHIGLLVCLGAMVWRGRGAAIAMVGGVAAVLIAVPTLYQSVFIRWAALVSGQSVGTVADRLLWWQRGWAAAREASPAFGIGKSFRNPLLDGTFPFHSIVVQVFVESGFVGVLAMGFAFLSGFVALLRLHAETRRTSSNAPAVSTPQILAVFAVYLGMGLSENTFLSGFQNWVFWGVLGSMTGVLAAQASERTSSNGGFVPVFATPQLSSETR